METIDVNCLLGHWPFRKIYKNSFQDLKKVHAENNISYGYVSSLNSIFYNDPFEGDEELHEIIKDTSYKHVLTVNPTLPGFENDISRGIEIFNIKGVRIYPGYHGYKLGDPCVKELCTILDTYSLPLFVTVRMEDERINYIFKPLPVTAEDITALLGMTCGSIILLSIRYAEILPLKEVINARKGAFIDTSGLGHYLFVIEKLLKEIKPEKIIYGSQHPLYCLKSSMLVVEKAEIDEEIRGMILGENAKSL